MRSVARLYPALVVSVLAFGLTGCGGGGGGGGTGPSPVAATYSIEWAARARTAGPSSAQSVTFTLQNAQNQTVLTDVRNRNVAPAAYNASYTTTQRVSPGSYTAKFTFYGGSNGAGDVVASGSQTITLGEGGTVPSIAVAGTIATLTVGADQEVTVGQTRDLSFTARTAGGQAVAVTPGSAFWAVTSGSEFATAGPNGVTGVAPGTANVTVTVDGKTSPAVPVTVAAPGTELTILVPGREVTFAAYQEGDGEWIPIETLGTNMTARVAGGKYGVAVAFTDEFEQRELQIFHATTAETTTVTVAPPSVNYDQDILQGTLSNLGAANSVALYGAYGTTGFLPENAFYTAQMAKKNPWDLVAVLQNTETNAPISVAVRRGLTAVPLNDMNLNAAADFSPVTTNTLTGTGAHLDAATLVAELNTGNGTIASLGIGSESPITVASLPVALRNANDRYAYMGFTFGDNWSNAVTQIRTTPANTTLALQEPIGNPTVTSEGVGEGVRGRAEFTTNGSKLYEVVFNGATTYRTFLTPGWLGLAGVKTYLTPELFEVPGWDTAWSLGDFVDWNLRGYTNNGTLADLFEGSSLLRDGYQWSTSDRFSSSDLLTRTQKATKRRLGLPGAPVRAKR